MSEKVQLKGGICEFDFGYNAKMEGYTTLMLDIPKLGEIGNKIIIIDIKYSE
jgi:hypothetical protein